jgi:pyruvate dehydrogenase E1 component beta subunit
MTDMTHAEALAGAICEALAKNKNVTIFNPSFGGLSPSRAKYNVIREKFGDRCTDSPIAELGYCGIAIGAAMTGMRPLVGLSTGAFSYEAWPQIVNEAAVACYGSAGRVTCPVTFHLLTGIRGAGAVQHSHAVQAMLCNAPGLQVVMPSTPQDARGLMLEALLNSKNPTVFVDHQKLQGLSADVDAKSKPIPFGVADVKREGKDVTIVACGVMVPRALEAAATLEKAGISAEVVDPRTIVPLDKATILKSVRKTGRVVVADESQLTCGVASELSATIAEEAFDALKAPIRRVAIPNVPIPFHLDEEEYVTPSTGHIIAAVKDVCK